MWIIYYKNDRIAPMQKLRFILICLLAVLVLNSSFALALASCSCFANITVVDTVDLNAAANAGEAYDMPACHKMTASDSESDNIAAQPDGYSSAYDVKSGKCGKCGCGNCKISSTALPSGSVGQQLHIARGNAVLPHKCAQLPSVAYTIYTPPKVISVL